MSEFFDAQGNAIPEDQLANAFAAGEAFHDADASYDVRDPSGQVKSVKGTEIPNALAAGWTPLTPTEAASAAKEEQLKSGGQRALTALERGASSATAGITDIIARQVAPEYADASRGRAAANPSVTGFSEAVGSLVPFSVAGKIAKPVKALTGLAKPTTAIGRMALRAAGEAAPYALEGALYGGTSTAGNLALNDQAITAEKVLAGAGQGAVLGGLLGLGSQAGAAGLRRASKSLDEFAEGLAKGLGKETSSARQAISELQPSARRVRERIGRNVSALDDSLEQAGKDYLGYVIKDGPMKGKRIFHGARTPTDVIDDVTHAWNETGREVGKFRDAADEIGRADAGARPDSLALNQKLDEALGELTSDPFAPRSARRLARRIEKDHLEPLRQWRDAGRADPVEQLQAVGLENTNYLRDGMRDLVEHRKAYDGLTADQVEAIATGQAPTNRGKPFEPVRVTLDQDGTMVLQDGRHRMTAAREAGAKDILATVQVRDEAGDVVREWTGPVSISGRPISPDGAPSLSQIDRIRQGVGDALAAAKRAGKPEEIRALKKVYGTLTDTIDSTIESALAPQGVNLAEYKQAKQVYSSLSFVKNAIEDMKLRAATGAKPRADGELPGGLGYALTQALTGNFGNAATSLGRSLLGDSVAGALSGNAARTTSLLQQGAKALAHGATGLERAAKYAPSSTVRYLLAAKPEQTFERLQETVSSPERLMQYAADRTAPWAGQYPELATQAQQILIGDLQYLASKAPAAFRSHESGLRPLTKPDQTWSHPDVRAWLERAAALEDPATTVNAMLEGRVPFAAIEALEERRPGLWAELRQEVAQAVAENETEVPFRRRVFLGTAFKFPADYSMLPDTGAQLQAPHVQPEEQGGMTQAQTQRLDGAADAMMTTTDRLEM